MTAITVHADRRIGQIKPVHGVNNGPVTYGSLVDVTDYYISMGVPLVRLHDPNWPHPREVDIHIVFPDFDKDPADPGSYNFSQTDEYMRTVAATGAQIVFRLGESIEHTAKKYFVHPPQSGRKWADICIGVIKHYNQGWADGFHYGIKYWEIWNEPDYSVKMWSGTHEQYYSLYATASKAIKQFDPSLKVGGPAVARPTAEFVPEFLQHCREQGAPLDFFSWHTYTADPELIRSRALHVRTMLDQHGFEDAETHLNEWNYFGADFATIWNKGNEHIRKKTFDLQKGPEGASFSAYVLSMLQDLPVDQANYYDGQPTALFCGLFDYHGVPQKTYWAFHAFNELSKHSARLLCEWTDEGAGDQDRQEGQDRQGLYGLAGQDEFGGTAALITNFHGEERKVTVRLAGGERDGEQRHVRIYAIDGQRDMELIREERLSAGELELYMSEYSVYYIAID